MWRVVATFKDEDGEYTDTYDHLDHYYAKLQWSAIVNMMRDIPRYPVVRAQVLDDCNRLVRDTDSANIYDPEGN